MPKYTDYKAVCIGSDSLNHLFYGGVLVSVFSSTINIKTADEELVVITSKEIRSPIHINVRPPEPFRLKAMTNVVVEDGKIKLEGSDVILDEYEVFENDIVSPSKESLNAFIGYEGYFATLLALMGTYALEPGPLQERVLEFIKGLIEGEEVDPSLLLGLGPGFTPSGDDILSGYLACRNHLASAGLTRPLTIFPKGKTAWISGKMIEYSQSLKVDSTMEKALNSISMGRPWLLAEALLELTPRGHTSGPDMAFGLLIALYEALGEIGQFFKKLFKVK